MQHNCQKAAQWPGNIAQGDTQQVNMHAPQLHLPANMTFTQAYIFQKHDVGLDAPAQQQSRCSSLAFKHIQRNFELAARQAARLLLCNTCTRQIDKAA